MFRSVSPELAGIASSHVEKFIHLLNRRGLVMHSVLLMKGEDIFGEFYWEPFNVASCHRMYSETKSYVSIAVGLLEQDGALSLDDPIALYFPDKIDRELPSYLKSLTIRNMLMMETCGETPSWFYHSDPDRTHLYFAENTSEVPGGMRWSYDSPGSQVLCSLVERLSGMSLFEFLHARVFSKLGTFTTASILKTKTDDSFGDSALLCTTRDMASFARFVMNYGVWNGERILNENYLRTATSPLADNDLSGFDDVFSKGYGYQIWATERGGFAFNGMGCQFTVCLPELDLIFVCTGDNQGFESAKSLVLSAFFEEIVDNISPEAIPDNPEAFKRCNDLAEGLKLAHLRGNRASAYSGILQDKRWICDDNPMGITEFSLHFNGDDTAEWRYINAQGEKKLPFGFGFNVFSKFPQFGYSDGHAGLSAGGDFLYDCASSAAWREEKKLLLKVQIIDKYLGNMLVMFSFDGDRALVRMVKHAEAFLDEYEGIMLARCE